MKTENREENKKSMERKDIMKNKLKRYGEDYKLDQEEMYNIQSYMNDDIREDLHAELAPCEPEEFLEAYLKRDPEFADLLKNQFGIEFNSEEALPDKQKDNTPQQKPTRKR